MKNSIHSANYHTSSVLCSMEFLPASFVCGLGQMLNGKFLKGFGLISAFGLAVFYGIKEFSPTADAITNIPAYLCWATAVAIWLFATVDFFDILAQKKLNTGADWINLNAAKVPSTTIESEIESATPEATQETHSGTPSIDTAAIYEQARIFHLQDKLDDAKKGYQQILEQSPQDSECYFQLGKICLDQEDETQAKTYFAKCSEFDKEEKWTQEIKFLLEDYNEEL